MLSEELRGWRGSRTVSRRKEDSAGPQPSARGGRRQSHEADETAIARVLLEPGMGMVMIAMGALVRVVLIVMAVVRMEAVILNVESYEKRQDSIPIFSSAIAIIVMLRYAKVIMVIEISLVLIVINMTTLYDDDM